MGKIIYSIFILLFLSSCGLTQVQEKLTERYPASFFKDCKRAITGFFGKTRVPVNNWQNLENLNLSSGNDRQFIEGFLNSSLIRELEIQSLIRNKFDSSFPQDTEALKKILIIAINERSASISRGDHLIKMIEKYRKVQLPDDLIVEALSNNYFTKKGIISLGTVDTIIELDPQTFWKNQLMERAKNISTNNTYKDFVQSLKSPGLNSSTVEEILKTPYYFKRILESDPDFAINLSKALKENIEWDSDYIFDNLRRAMQMIVSPKPEELFSHANSSFTFFKGIERLVNNKLISKKTFREKIVKSIGQAPFAIKMRIPSKELDDFIKSLEVLKQEKPLHLEDVVEMAKRKWNLSNKNLENIDYYDKELQVIGVKNQCGWGSCWIHSPTEKLEIELSKELGKDTEVSVDYIYLNYLINSYQDSIISSTKLEAAPISEGGWEDFYRIYVDKFGLVPKNAWHPKTPLHNDYHANNFKNKMKQLLSQYYEESQGLRTGVRLDHLRKEYFKKIKQLADDFYGEMPKTFTFRGETYSPKEFAEQYRHNWDQETEVWKIDNGYGLNTGSWEKSTRVLDQESLQWSRSYMTRTVKEKSLEEVEQMIIESINKDRPVRIAVKWIQNKSFTQNGVNLAYADKKTGMMKAPSQDAFEAGSGGHAILVVGYELDFSGRIKTLKILNSWGKDSGDRGFYHMDASYLKEYLKDVFVNTSDQLGEYRFSRPSSLIAQHTH